MREELLDLLARLVADGLLTEDAARELLAQFDAGELMQWDMPLAPQADGVRGFDSATIAAALAALLLLTGNRRPTAPTALGPNLAVVTQLQTSFGSQSATLAAQLAAGRVPVTAWQQSMISTLQANLTQQMLAASGRTSLTARQMQRLDALMREQTAYLSRFADQITLRAATGQPFSAEYLAQRAAQYGGAGRGLFFEESEVAALEEGVIGVGWLIYYISRDDRATCGNCISAQQNGPYLPGAPHPQPGVVCLGRAACRCRIEWRYEPNLYRRMTR